MLVTPKCCWESLHGDAKKAVVWVSRGCVLVGSALRIESICGAKALEQYLPCERSSFLTERGKKPPCLVDLILADGVFMQNFALTVMHATELAIASVLLAANQQAAPATS